MYKEMPSDDVLAEELVAAVESELDHRWHYWRQIFRHKRDIHLRLMCHLLETVYEAVYPHLAALAKEVTVGWATVTVSAGAFFGYDGIVITLWLDPGNKKLSLYCMGNYHCSWDWKGIKRGPRRGGRGRPVILSRPHGPLPEDNNTAFSTNWDGEANG